MKNSIKKWAEDPKIFPKKKYKRPTYTYEKMIYFTSYKGNASQNHSEIPLCKCQNALNNKARNDKCWREC